MALILPSRATRIVQPSGPVEVDWINPIATGLRLLPIISAGGVDAVSGFSAPTDAGVTRQSSEYGRVLRGTTVADGFKLTPSGGLSSIFPTASPYTVMALIRVSTINARRIFLGDFNATGLNESICMEQAANNTWRFYHVTTADAGVSISTPGVSVGWHWVEMQWDGSALTGRVDSASTTTAANSTSRRAGIDFRAMRAGAFTSAGFNGDFAFLGIWNRWLPLVDRDAIRSNPWQLFKKQERSIIIDLGAGGGPVGGNASATPAPLTVTPATATATGAASTSATPAPVSATPAQATATGGAAAQATPAPVQITPATGTASGAAGGEVTASATPAPLSISAPTGTATGGAAAQATPAPITTTAPTASVGSGASASATLAALGLMPATGTATGGAVASALPAQIIVTPAAGGAKGGAQAYAAPAQITITPATGIGSDGTYAPINWPSGAAASRAAIVPPFYGLAIVGPVYPAIVPVHGDDMQPIKTFELHPDDREIYEVDFDRLYLSTARDSAATLEAISAPAGLTVTPEVSVGGALTSGVVRFAAAQTGGPGSYDVSARISTAAGRRKTATVTIAVAP